MKFDVTKLPLGEALIGFVLAAVAGTFILAFIIGTNDGGIGGEGSGDEGVAEVSPTPERTPSDGGTPTPGGDTFAVSMGDNFFDPDTFTVAAGSSVTFDISNDGQAIHNMRVDGGDGEYNSDDDTVSDPDLFTPGDTGTLVWQVPGEAGEFIFRCDFHPIEMVGTITVE